MKKSTAAIALILTAASAGSHALDDAELAGLVRQRLQGDRSGACMAVAVIEKERVARTWQCADDRDLPRIGPDTTFEIGSVSKTMTAALLADLILQGKGALDDPLSAWLPEHARVPDYQGQPILLRHLVTHTSGLPVLPSRLGATRMDDPYANLDEAALLASLGDVTLNAAPGSRFEYSNFAAMLLSYAVARRAGSDLGTLLRERLFAPLGMRHAHLGAAPAGIRAATGHTPNRQPAAAWTFATDLAGVGGVRATLEDMTHFLRGQLGQPETTVTPALRLTQERLLPRPPMAMNWMLLRAAGRVVHVHEGGTGGFSSFVSVDKERQRGVVILSDTAWNSIGGLGSLGLHLTDDAFPLDEPRRTATPDAALLDTLAGEWELASGLRMTLRRRGDALEIQAAGQGAYRMAYDSAGDFHPHDFDAILRPQRTADGHEFTWIQMGGAIPAKRIGPASGAD